MTTRADILRAWREANPEKIVKSFEMDAVTRNRFTNSMPTVASFLAGEYPPANPAPPLATFFGIRIVVNQAVPRDEIWHVNYRGDVLERTKMEYE
jgi:hypothetical protein